MENKQLQRFVSEIRELPCFKSNVLPNNLQINIIEKGQSSQCFVVQNKQGKFFVKYLKTDAGVNAELTAAKVAGEKNFGAKVIFVNSHWLVCEFLEGEALDNLVSTVDERIKVSLALMSTCHSTKANLPVFNIQHAIKDLLSDSFFTAFQRKTINQALGHIEKIEIDKRVFCHGDLNFTNVMISDKPWLLDFECACLAEPEFDLAMFIAINRLTESDFDKVTEYYHLNGNAYPNKGRLVSYLQYCYVLNALWYLQRGLQMDGDTSFKTLGLKQLELFDDISTVETSVALLMR